MKIRIIFLLHDENQKLKLKNALDIDEEMKGDLHWQWQVLHQNQNVVVWLWLCLLIVIVGSAKQRVLCGQQ